MHDKAGITQGGEGMKNRATPSLVRAAAAATILALIISPASAVNGQAKGAERRTGSGASTHSFEGSCAIVGYAVLADPMTLVPTQSSFEFTGTGRCVGTLDGTVLPQRGVPVSYASQGPRTIQSCELGLDLGITWTLTFELPERPVRLYGNGNIIDVLRLQEGVIQGQAGGVAVGQNTIQGHLETLDPCLGDGVSEGSVGIQMETITPLASKQSPEQRDA